MYLNVNNMLKASQNPWWSCVRVTYWQQVSHSLHKSHLVQTASLLHRRLVHSELVY